MLQEHDIQHPYRPRQAVHQEAHHEAIHQHEAGVEVKVTWRRATHTGGEQGSQGLLRVGSEIG